MQHGINIYLFFFKHTVLILFLTALCLWQPVLLYFKDSWIMLSFFEADKPEWSCTKLRCLNASYNNLEMLPTEISSCSGLVELDASNNKLVAFPSPWECKLVNVPWVLYFSLSNAFTVQLACHVMWSWEQIFFFCSPHWIFLIMWWFALLPVWNSSGVQHWKSSIWTTTSWKKWQRAWSNSVSRRCSYSTKTEPF